MTDVKLAKSHVFCKGLFLILIIAFYDVSPAFGRYVAEDGGARNDSTGIFSRTAKLGENILDVFTWKMGDYVLTIYPVMGANSRSGFVYGIMPAVKWNSAREGRVNTVTINAEASIKGMKQLQLEHEWYFLPMWLTSGNIVLDSREDQFWPGEENNDFYFERRETRFSLDVLNNIAPFLWFGLDMLISNNRFPENVPANYSNGQLAGHQGGWLAGAGPKAVYDSRDRTLAPQKGIWLQISPMLVGVVGLGDYKFNRISVDARRYLQLKKDKSTLAIQVLMDYAEGNIPFYEMPGLGGNERLRGIGHPLRKTGNALWMTRAELRQHLWWRFGGVVFAGVGQASSDFQKPFAGTVGSFGGGLRFRMLPGDPLNVRFDFGISSMGTTGFFISLKEAF